MVDLLEILIIYSLYVVLPIIYSIYCFGFKRTVAFFTIFIIFNNILFIDEKTNSSESSFQLILGKIRAGGSGGLEDIPKFMGTSFVPPSKPEDKQCPVSDNKNPRPYSQRFLSGSGSDKEVVTVEIMILVVRKHQTLLAERRGNNAILMMALNVLVRKKK